MADNAHGNIRSNKLRQVAAGARLMSREPRRRRIIAALVTGGTGKRRVALARVFEVGIVEFRTLRRSDKHRQLSMQPLGSLCLCGEHNVCGTSHRDTENTEAAQRCKRGHRKVIEEVLKGP